MTHPSQNPSEQPPEWPPRHFSRRYFKRHQRPKWWPENEPWPPERGRSRHHLPFRRFGCFFAFLIMLLCGFLFVAPVLIGFILGQVDFSQFSLRIPYLLGLAVFVLAVVFVGGYGLRRIFTPLDDLLNAADRVAEGDYSVQVRERGPREFRSLAHAFNKMASRLHLSDEQRRNLLADVTHELHTPLTVIQGNLEGMLDGVYPADEANLRSLLDESMVLSRLVEDLRTFALAESGALKLKKEPTDLRTLIRDTAAAFQPQADAASVTLAVEATEDFPWLEVDPGRIRQVLSNLMANALRYTPAGGIVSVHYTQEDRSAFIEVRDTGPGIPAEELTYIFERFHKSTDSGGMGLGLAIAKHLVEAHGGALIAKSAPGLGTTMLISLPLDG
jgi:two-component system, OmpR family, sensor histidine kinase BaeS